MKKIIAVIGLLSILIVSGCSLLGEVNNSLEYANKVTDYINTAKGFAEEVPSLAQDAVTNTEARDNLEMELLKMQEEIIAFNEIEAPSIAAEIHEKIESTNTKLQEGIDLYLTNIENGELDPAVLENSEILKTLNEITQFMDQIESLGL
ncbi:DUF6376 family protein [Bacillus sp. FJAT-50079]|uniref:DUF6376 family protein n=1 Tax=Bacillus sp. FJAT-50079 TaxID=2833577 RepID=UPI001BC92BFF|nr:DUF6376 family protein [Bacillus sp. FJAT-50079]MBS4210207.1 hypothetical protein [Bacillus sp. FJAT-50079]